MTQDEAFLQAIREDPGDEANWLIYADWLEEHGNPLAAVYRCRRLTNSLDMELVLIPDGTFRMGSPKNLKGRHDDETPQHQVTITMPFYLGVHPATQAEYHRLTGTNPSHFAAGGSRADRVVGLDTERFPVEEVTWEDAVAFCRRLSDLPAEKKLGRRYRLPTEAEWEYACRAGARRSTRFSFGRSLSAAQANCETPDSFRRPTPVGSYPDNAFRLCDMHGNVWNWCQDWYDPTYYGRSPREDPHGPDSPPSDHRRCLRGGAWDTAPRHCRSAWRAGSSPTARANTIGFRVLLEVEGIVAAGLQLAGR
jgi:uncharacterized protein (TIGR02996 family)